MGARRAPLICVAAGLALLAPYTPVIRAGREAEIQALFAGVGRGETAGWRVSAIAIPRDRIHVTLVGPSGREATLAFRSRGVRPAPVARTPSFDVFVLASRQVSPEEAAALARAVAAAVTRNDDGHFWRNDPPLGARRLLDTMTSVARQAEVAWAAGLVALVALCAGVVGARRPWRTAEGRRALAEVAGVVVAAFLVRALLCPWGVADIGSRIPIPGDLLGELPNLGPGFDAWLRAWFAAAGADDTTAFLAGTTAGALTAAPVYLIGWLGAGRRKAGFAAAVALAALPIHARMSPNDDRCALVALLLATSLALAIAAERAASPAALAGSWLAAALAATTRPDAAMALPALAALAAAHPTARRIQARPAVLVATVACLAPALAAVAIAGSKALADYSFVAALAPSHLARLVGARGASILSPSRTPWPVTALALAGLVMASRATRGRALLWVLVGLLPAVPTTPLAGSDAVTARYQVPLLPVVAVLVGAGLVGLRDMLDRRPRARLLGRAAGPALVAAALVSIAFHAPPEPTFRLEYAFFRENIARVPPSCRLVLVDWNRDLGLHPPVHLTRLRRTGHVWVDAAEGPLEPDAECLVYWRPATCLAIAPDLGAGAGRLLPACERVERAFRLEPIARALLPARPGFADRYQVDPVPVGFYRLRARSDR